MVACFNANLLVGGLGLRSQPSCCVWFTGAMATETITTIVCDRCGKVAKDPTTITIAWGKEQWELDLCDKDNTAVNKIWEDLTTGARKVGRSPAAGRRSSSAGSSNKEELAAIRAWARANGWTVGDKGRIAAEIRDAYAAAK